MEEGNWGERGYDIYETQALSLSIHFLHVLQIIWIVHNSFIICAFAYPGNFLSIIKNDALHYTERITYLAHSVSHIVWDCSLKVAAGILNCGRGINTWLRGCFILGHKCTSPTFPHIIHMVFAIDLFSTAKMFLYEALLYYHDPDELVFFFCTSYM